MNTLKANSWIVFSLACLGLLIACQSHPEPIEFGVDQCAYCKMTIADNKFGAELITPHGRVLKYDAAECMAQDIGNDGQEYSALYAIPIDLPGTLKPIDSLYFVIDEQIRSPMGANLAAFHRKQNANDHDAPSIRWPMVVDQLKRK